MTTNLLLNTKKATLFSSSEIGQIQFQISELKSIFGVSKEQS